MMMGRTDEGIMIYTRFWIMRDMTYVYTVYTTNSINHNTIFAVRE